MLRYNEKSDLNEGRLAASYQENILRDRTSKQSLLLYMNCWGRSKGSG